MEKLIAKMQRIAHPLTGWTDAERAILKSLVPTPKAIAKSITRLMELRDGKTRSHPADCLCYLCLGADWWTEPEDASEELTLAREELKKELDKWEASLNIWDEEKQQFVKPEGRI